MSPRPNAPTTHSAPDDPQLTASCGSGSIVERVRNRRGEGDKLRNDLLDAAADLMAETGSISGVSLRAVAARAGVSPTAVYRHFDDHLSLLQAAVEYCWHEFETALLDSYDETQSPHERLHEAGLAYMNFAYDQPGKYRVLFSNRIDVGKDEQSVGETAFDWLVGLVTAVLDANDDDRDPFFVAVQVHTWIHGIVDLCGRHPEFGWPSHEQQLSDLGERLGIVDPPDAV